MCSAGVGGDEANIGSPLSKAGGICSVAGLVGVGWGDWRGPGRVKEGTQEGCGGGKEGAVAIMDTVSFIQKLSERCRI